MALQKHFCFVVEGLTQYSGDPRTEWQLNSFTTKQELLEAVRNFKYKGGNTFTGTDNKSSSSIVLPIRSCVTHDEVMCGIKKNMNINY